MEKTENAEKKAENQLPEKLNEVLSSDPQEVQRLDHAEAVDELIVSCMEKKQLKKILPVVKMLNPSISTIRKMVQYFSEAAPDVSMALHSLSFLTVISDNDLERFRRYYFEGDSQWKIIMDSGAADKVINHWCEQGDASRAVLSSILLRDGNLTNDEIGKLTGAIEKMVIVA